MRKLLLIGVGLASANKHDSIGSLEPDGGAREQDKCAQLIEEFTGELFWYQRRAETGNTDEYWWLWDDIDAATLHMRRELELACAGAEPDKHKEAMKEFKKAEERARAAIHRSEECEELSLEFKQKLVTLGVWAQDEIEESEFSSELDRFMRGMDRELEETCGGTESDQYKAALKALDEAKRGAIVAFRGGYH